VETMVMAGRKGTGAGWTIGDIGAAAGAGAGDCMAVGGSYICESAIGRAGTFKCEFGFEFGFGMGISSSSKPPLQPPHRSLSPRRLRIRGRAGVSGWYLRLL